MHERPIGIARRIIWFEGASRRAYWTQFAILISMSVIMATMGLTRNSGPVVIAAMLIAPLMTPILGIAAAMVSARFVRALALVFGVAIAAVGSVLLAYGMMFVADVPRGIVLPTEVLARTDPGIEELIVALVSGVAGAYVQIHREEISLLPGAAIGVSLVPPLSAAGILLYFSEFDAAYYAILLFVTNFSAIIFAASAVYAYYAIRLMARARRRRLKFLSASIVASLVVLLAVSIQLGSKTLERFRESRYEQSAARAVLAWAGNEPVEILRLDVDVKSHRAELWLIVDVPYSTGDALMSPNEMIPPELRDGLKDNLRSTLGAAYKVAVRYQFRFGGELDLATERVNRVPTFEAD